MDKRISDRKEKYEGTIWKSNSCGNFIILEYNTHDNIIVRFLSTDYETNVSFKHVKDGGIKDRLHLSVCGKGYVGVGKHRTHVKGKATKPYRLWRGVLQRCYSENNLEKHPTYRGCSVVEEWHNFQNFAEWFEENYIEGYHLDKDIKVKGNKVYGPSTCLFVTPKANAAEAIAKHYKMLNPSGDLIEIYNMNAFCRDHNLCASNMRNVFRGARKHHRGWTKYEEEIL